MTEDLASILSTADDSMKKAINHLETELIKKEPEKRIHK